LGKFEGKGAAILHRRARAWFALKGLQAVAHGAPANDVGTQQQETVGGRTRTCAAGHADDEPVCGCGG
jgi:hypothetical protein